MKVCLCGSKKILVKLLYVGKHLEEKGYDVLYPKEIINGLSKGKNHFDRIKESDVVLVVNDYYTDLKNNKTYFNYIGGNTLAEIGFAYYFDKPIYLLEDYYRPYIDELKLWNVIPLHGYLNKLGKEEIYDN